ncbi:MAG: hypothetical protein CYPHOPRED_001951 [Cyphobasidiales sp. Tagirdzhanova-0007]|nr:MAG: hypothetical protein CYPHOPRED_001951 [Cyphobasidiales sp. Tagirdzhanova-0007]
MQIGEWGACISINGAALQNATNHHDKFCSKVTNNFDIYLNLNDSRFFTNFPITADSDTILGYTKPAGTIQSIQILSKSQTSIAFLHLVTALIALLCVGSLIVPPRWLHGGKSSLAQVQRSGIISLVLGAIAMVLAFATFVVLIVIVQSGKKKFNAVPGITATWSSSFIGWFLLPSAILYIPAFLSVLLPTYVRPVEQDDDDDDSISAPMAPLVHQREPQGTGMGMGMHKSVESFRTGSGSTGASVGGSSNVQTMYGKGGYSSYPTSRPI